LLAYDRLRVLLRDDLGIAPSAAVQAIHRRLLDDTTTTPA
jgi:DNA-binding SARP family transcriptional activator